MRMSDPTLALRCAATRRPRSRGSRAAEDARPGVVASGAVGELVQLGRTAPSGDWTQQQVGRRASSSLCLSRGDVREALTPLYSPNPQAGELLAALADASRAARAALVAADGVALCVALMQHEDGGPTAGAAGAAGANAASALRERAAEVLRALVDDEEQHAKLAHDGVDLAGALVRALSGESAAGAGSAAGGGPLSPWARAVSAELLSTLAQSRQPCGRG